MARLIDEAIQKGFGCWYCGGKDGDDLVFSVARKTSVHKCCAYGASARNPHDKEAQTFIAEFED
ncbi:hypothetical protein ACFVS2_21780 [Brevibacillus sp. NPDC058079]|uniref:hypothetical protein n=1 Tax=Brevibacillus sp. NPDC058079 TaxID=3346330 RepID=UPI0036E4F7BD